MRTNGRGPSAKRCRYGGEWGRPVGRGLQKYRKYQGYIIKKFKNFPDL